MSGVSHLMIVGNVGHEPELSQSKAGKPWLRMNIAVSRRRAGVETTDWHDVRVFGEQAVVCAQMLRKGSQVCVYGELIYEKWTDDDERVQRSARVMARQVTFLNRYGNQGLTPPGEAPSSGYTRSAYG